MAIAGPPAAKFANRLGQADLWELPNVDMGPIHTVVGRASAVTRDETCASMLNFLTLSPTVLADRICVTHAPTLHPARAGAVSQHDNIVFTLIGDDSGATLNITLPAEALRTYQ